VLPTIACPRLAIEQDVSHAVMAIEDSALLLTIAWRGHR
jgi:hypothetical protein